MVERTSEGGQEAGRGLQLGKAWGLGLQYLKELT